MVFYIISLIFVPILIIGAFLRRRRRHGRELDESNWYLQLSLSPKDAMSQWFLILGGLALANMIYAINNNFGSPLSWRLVLLAAILIFGALAYWGKSVYAAAIGVIGFLVWWTAQTAFWQPRELTVPIIGLMWLAILLYVAGFWQMGKSAWKRFGVAWVSIGLILVNFLLFVFSTQSGLLMLQKMIGNGGIFDAWQNVISLFIIAVMVAMALLYGCFKKIVLMEEATFAGILFLIFGLLAALPGQSLFDAGGWSNQLNAAGLFWAVAFNLALLFEILGVIFAGYLRREIWMINFGTVLLLIFTAVKYFDWFFKFMDKSVFFIVAGIMLFAIGWGMERGRRYLTRSINSQINQSNQ
jgi:hypothetical protein